MNIRLLIVLCAVVAYGLAQAVQLSENQQYYWWGYSMKYNFAQAGDPGLPAEYIYEWKSDNKPHDVERICKLAKGYKNSLYAFHFGWSTEQWIGFKVTTDAEGNKIVCGYERDDLPVGRQNHFPVCEFDGGCMPKDPTGECLTAKGRDGKDYDHCPVKPQ